MVTVLTFGQVLMEINAYRSRRLERLGSFGWMLLILVETKFFLDVRWHCGQAWVAALSVWQVCHVFLVLFSVMRCRVDDVTLFEKQFEQMKKIGCTSSRPRFTSYVTKSSTNIQTTSSSRSVHLNKCWICAVISASTSKLQPPRQACKALRRKNVSLRHLPDAHDRSAQITKHTEERMWAWGIFQMLMTDLHKSDCPLFFHTKIVIYIWNSYPRHEFVDDGKQSQNVAARIWFRFNIQW